MTINPALFSSAKEDWETPQAFFDELNAKFAFTLDPCATRQNAKCTHFYTKAENGLLQSWGGATGVLQSSLWAQDRSMGGKVLHGGAKTRYPGGRPAARPDRYTMVSRLHTGQGNGPFRPWTAAFWWQQKFCAVPEHNRVVVVRRKEK